jgi:spore coat polysaccharide biosynthesis predicted glycosyltransferase SpsG
VGRALSGPLLTVLATAGRGEGRGHLARALALAEAAQEAGSGATIVLLRGEPSAAERGRALAAGAELAGEDAMVALAGPAVRAGASGGLDESPDQIIVDLPDPNEASAAVLARATVFDDRQLLASPARVVVQPSLPAWSPARGASAGRALVGYAFAPLGRSVLQAAARAAEERRVSRADHLVPAAAAIPRVLLCFGGSDPGDVTARLGSALAADPRWSLDLVVGPDYRGAAGARGLAVLREPPDLARLLKAADVAVLGAGTMKFEAAALGTPTLLLAVADDQLPVGPPFAVTGAAAWAGDGRAVEPALVVELLAGLALDPGRRAAMARRGPEIVPGDGARRIVAATMTDIGTEEAE